VLNSSPLRTRARSVLLDCDEPLVQPIASASSVIDAIMRAKVRVASDSSSGGS
jgi:hypothetical protein